MLIAMEDDGSKWVRLEDYEVVLNMLGEARSFIETLTGNEVNQEGAVDTLLEEIAKVE